MSAPVRSLSSIASASVASKLPGRVSGIAIASMAASRSSEVIEAGGEGRGRVVEKDGRGKPLLEGWGLAVYLPEVVASWRIWRGSSVSI